MKIRTLLFIALALAVAPMSFGATVSGSGGTISSCTNLPSSPTNVGGTLYTQLDCSLYNDVSSYSFDLTPLMEQDGANLYDNLVGAGYIVVINGDPNTLPDDGTGLFNQTLWVAVLYWPGDQDAGTASDSLTMYWSGDPLFPTPLEVQTLDDSLYGTGIDPEFFVQSTPPETVYAPAGIGGDEYDIYVPEPGTMLLLGSGLAVLGGVVLRRRRAARRAA
jgi:hypothetical protein